MEEKTIFKRIIDGEIPAQIVYEDAIVVAFLDIAPNNLGHTLVVPKEPFRNILTTPDDVSAHLVLVAKKIGVSLMKGLGAKGINIIMNNEEAAGQIVFHTHLHVIPRYKNDGHKHWKQSPYKSAEEAEAVAKKIREAL